MASEHGPKNLSNRSNCVKYFYYSSSFKGQENLTAMGCSITKKENKTQTT